MELRRAAGRLSQIVVEKLQDSARYLGADPAEQGRLGVLALECIGFQRSLLEHRPGPKRSEEEQLRKMEQQVNAIMSRLEKKGSKNDQSELTGVSKDLREFWRLRKHSRK